MRASTPFPIKPPIALRFSVSTGGTASGSTLSVSGNAYYRYIRTATLNGDINEDSLDQSVYQPSAADIRGAHGRRLHRVSRPAAPLPPTRRFRSGAASRKRCKRDEPGEKCNGLLNRTRSEQHNYGLSGQMTWLGSPHGNHNQFTVGAAYDGSVVNFVQSSQLGYLNPDRTVTGVNAFGDGVTGGNVDGAPFDTRVDLHGMINTGSVYATDTLSAGKWNLTLSGPLQPHHHRQS